MGRYSTRVLEYPIGIKDRVHLDIEAFKYRKPSIVDRNATTYRRVEPSETATNELQQKTLAARRESDNNKEKTYTLERERDSLFFMKMYIPAGLTESISSSWETQNMAFLPDASKIKESIDLFSKEKYTEAYKAAGGNKALGGIVGTAAVSLAAEKMGALKSTVEAAAGMRLAPNEAKVYSGTPGRDLPLSFTFAPRNEREAANMIEIIENFRIGLLPSLDQTVTLGLLNLYNYPPLFRIRVVNNSARVNSGAFWEYKMMALTGFSVAYSNETSEFSYFDKYTPTDATLSLTFTSIYPSELS